MTILFQCLGITGSILLLYGLLGFAVTQVSGIFFWTLIGTGVAMLLVYLLTNVKLEYFKVSNVKEVFGRRSLKYGTSSVVYTIIGIAIILVVNVISQDFHRQKDFTKNKVNTLADQSVRVMQKLKAPVNVYAFLDERNEKKAQLQFLLEMYRRESEQVKVNFYDPDKEKVIAQKFEALDGDIVLEAGGQTYKTQDVSEQTITQGIMKITRTETPIVCFTQGHGELDLNAEEENPRSMSFARSGLENEGFHPKPIDSISERVPGECAILVVAGPFQSFTKPEADALDSYLHNGGKALLLLDPNVPDPKFGAKDYGVVPTGLEDLAKKWGIELGANFIIEKHLQLFRGEQPELSVMATTYGNHPMVDPLKGKQVVFELLRSVRKIKGYFGTTIEIVFSAGNEKSWAETDVQRLFFAKQAQVDGEDLSGPVPFAIAAEKDIGATMADVKKPRLVIVGDSDFASNRMLKVFGLNYDFFLNALNWLSGEVEQISIRPKMLEASLIELSPEQATKIFYIAIVGVPMLVLIFGINLWWYRRRRG